MMRALGIVALAAAIGAAPEYAPARRLGGALPELPPPNAVGWLDETVDVAVDANGQVRLVELLEGTKAPPQLLTPAVRTWRFRPATIDEMPVATHVLAV